MSKSVIGIAFAASLLLGGAASAAVLATLRANSPAYPNPVRRVYEKPVFHADKGDVVEIVRWGTPLTQVRTKTGRLGWIDAARLDTVNIPAVLSISKPAPKASKLTAAEDSALAKRWLEAQKAANPVATVAPDTAKPASVDAPKTGASIAPVIDTAKPAAASSPATEAPKK